MGQEVVPFESTRVGKKLEQMLPPEQPETELYQLDPAIAKAALEKKDPLMAPVVAGAAASGVGMTGLTVVLFNLPGNPYHVGTHDADGIIALWICLAGFGPLAVSLPFSLILRNKFRKPNAMLADRLKTRIVGWAKKRYGVVLDESCLNDDLLSFLRYKQDLGQFHWLTAGGKPFKLVAGERGYYLEEHRQEEGEHAPLGSIAAIEHVEGTDITQLTGEAHVLAQQIQQQVEALSSQDLGQEEKYVLNRAQQDFKQVLAFNKRILEFGSPTAEESNLMAETLGTLSAELSAILTQVRADALIQLRVQRDYVKNRQRAVPSDRLSLVQPLEGAEAVVEPSSPQTAESSA